MLINWKTDKIYLYAGSTDMRKQINGLVDIVQNHMGDCLWQKRLEKDRFPWPEHQNQVKEISRSKLRMLFRGIDFFHTHKKLDYKEA